MPVRQGVPIGFSGAMTELENSVRYAALLGLLKYVTLVETDRNKSGMKIGDMFEGLGENLFQKVKDLTKVFRI